LPTRTTPDDYERILGRFYRLAFQMAQFGLARRIMHPSERAWRTLAGNQERASRQKTITRLAPSTLRTLNRVLDHDFTSDFSFDSISASGAEAATELFRHLEVECAHVLVAHTHRAGPGESESPWVLPGGALLHNTGSWVSNTAFGDPPPAPFRPGDVTWLDEAGPPVRVNAFDDAADVSVAVPSEST
jgi:hypothetical protein